MEFLTVFPIFLLSIMIIAMIASIFQKNEYRSKKNNRVVELFKNGEAINYNLLGSSSFVISKDNGWDLDVEEKSFIKGNVVINVSELN